jgi:type IV fimbrial biogenesis protein FimT
MKCLRGFTLLELLVALAVASVLMAIAVPSFKHMIVANKLTTSANDIVGAIGSARMEAVRRNAQTQLCSNSSTQNSSDALGTACGIQAGAVYALEAGGTGQVLAGTTGIAAPIQLDGDMAAVRFDAQGMGYAVGSTSPYDGVVADICSSSISSDNHRVVSMVAGSVVTTTTSTGTCE